MRPQPRSCNANGQPGETRPCSYSALVLGSACDVLDSLEDCNALVDPLGSLAELEGERTPSTYPLSAGFELRGDLVCCFGDEGVQVRGVSFVWRVLEMLRVCALELASKLTSEGREGRSCFQKLLGRF
jgi:hypothetical protein